MSDNRKKSRRRRSVDEVPELTTLDKAIAKHLCFQCPTKKGMLMGSQVSYFNGAKAVECLIESKWSSISTKALAGGSTKESKDPVCFSSKHDAVQMLRKLLDSELFRRVVKVYKEEKSSAEQSSSKTVGDSSQSNTPRAVRQRKPKSTAPVEPATTTAKDDESKDKERSKKKKFKFELHDEQVFIDSPTEFYFWIYAPTTIKQYIMGALLVIGCIGVCLFPLWPAEVRTGVYYLSMVLASLLGVLLSLAVVKYIIFAGVWLLTMGKIKFWLLPNLTEDVGFFASFVPLYVLNVSSKKKTDKTSEKTDNQDEDDEEPTTANKRKENLNEDTKKSIESNVADPDESEQGEEEKEKSSSRSSSIDDGENGAKPQKSSDEDFEVLSKEELETK